MSPGGAEHAGSWEGCWRWLPFTQTEKQDLEASIGLSLSGSFKFPRGDTKPQGTLYDSPLELSWAPITQFFPA